MTIVRASRSRKLFLSSPVCESLLASRAFSIAIDAFALVALLCPLARGYQAIASAPTTRRSNQPNYRNLNVSPLPESLLPARDQPVAVPLSRRDEEGVVKAMDLETAGLAHQQRAGAHGDLGVDRPDAVGEARDDLVEPVAERIGALPTLRSAIRWLPFK